MNGFEFYSSLKYSLSSSDTVNPKQIKNENPELDTKTDLGPLSGQIHVENKYVSIVTYKTKTKQWDEIYFTPKKRTYNPIEEVTKLISQTTGLDIEIDKNEIEILVNPELYLEGTRTLTPQKPSYEQYEVQGEKLAESEKGKTIKTNLKDPYIFKKMKTKFSNKDNFDEVLEDMEKKIEQTETETH